MKKLSRKTISKSTQISYGLTQIFCAIILGYFGMIKQDYDNPIIVFVFTFMLLEGIYYFWKFYKKNDTIKFDDKF